jgi:HEAT repeat protein
VIWTAAFVLALLAPDDKEAEDAIATFKSAAKSSEVSVRVEAVRELARMPHEKVIRVLGTVLTTDDKVVRVAAAKALGAFQDKKPKAVSVLAEAIGYNTKEPEVEIAILSALRELRDKAALGVAYRYLDEKNEKIAEAAIGVTEAIKSRDSVEPLIKLIKHLIGAGDGVSSGDGSLDAPPDSRLQERARLLDSAAQKALRAITGESFSSPREWEGWWKRNGATFRVKE